MNKQNRGSIVYGLSDTRLRLEPFFVEFGATYLHGDLLPKDMDAPPEVLFLHGSNPDGRNGLLLLRHVLLEKFSISSCAFDCVGFGSTGGGDCPAEGGLAAQLAQATDIIDACFDAQPFSIVAADSSAEIAVQLAAVFPVRQLVLLNPPVGWKSSIQTPQQPIAMPVASGQTLVYMNTNTLLLAEIASVIHVTLQGDGRYVRHNYEEYGT